MSKLIKSNYVREIIKSLDQNEENVENLEQDGENKITYLNTQIEALEEELKLKEELFNQKLENRLKDTDLEVEKILEKAYSEKDELLEQTYLKAQEILEENRQKGYEDGYQNGYEEGKNSSDELVDEANEYKRQYWEMREKAISDAENDFVQILELISEKLFKKQLEDENIILSIVKNGMENIGNCTSVIVRVSEDDFDVLEISRSRILAMFPLVEDMQIKMDYSLNRGDCIIDSDRGSVDVSVEMQIDQIKELINNLLQNE